MGHGQTEYLPWPVNNLLMLMKIEVEGQLTEKEHAAAQWLHLKPRPVFVIVGVLLVILSLVVLWL